MRRVPEKVEQLARRQGGALAVAQAQALGMERHRVGRLVDDGVWQRLHRGVVVVHAGPVPWPTRARAALLYAGPGAAVSHEAAGYLHGFVRRAPDVIDVSVPGHRRVRATDGVRVRVRRVMPGTTAGIVTVSRADTVVDLVGDARTTDQAVALVCAAVRAGTWADEVLVALQRRARPRGRELLLDLLAAVELGVESALELRYHRDVEVPHGLPTAAFQVRRQVGGRWTRADRRYDVGVRIELDGELAHPGGRTDADVWRDNGALLLDGDLTLRYRWWHVAVTPCRTAGQVAAALRRRGWPGTLRPCGPGCEVVR